ncbi:MAG TPA: exonuclease subunit SbcD, partial [Bacilli bacterium]
MRVLHTADWHLGRTLEGRSRLEEQAAFLDELTHMVRDQQIDLILIAGDIYDSVNPPAAAELMFYDAVSRLAEGGVRQVIVIAGNHDNPERLAASGPLAAAHGITLIGHPTPAIQLVDIPETQERAMVYALPYPSESRLKELLTEETDEEILQAAYSKRVAHI